MSSFHSSQLVMSPAASDVKVSQAEGTMELRENVNPRCTRIFVHSSVCFPCVCVCIPSHGLLKIPFTVHTHTHTHTAPLNPCRGIKQCCCSNRALFFHPPTPPLSSFVFHFPCRVISLSLFLSLPLSPLSLSVRQHLSLSFSPFPPRCFASRVVIIKNHVWDSKAELSEY